MSERREIFKRAIGFINPRWQNEVSSPAGLSSGSMITTGGPSKAASLRTALWKSSPYHHYPGDTDIIMHRVDDRFFKVGALNDAQPHALGHNPPIPRPDLDLYRPAPVGGRCPRSIAVRPHPAR